jgi:alpha-L-fucosidase
MQYFLRMKDLIDQYEPDLLYTDGPIFFEEYGLSVVAHLYNTNARKHSGKCEAVYTSKRRDDSEAGTCILDLERGIVDKIWPNHWQTDTCVGNWHYKAGQKYKDGKLVLDMLVDIVSRNGNLLLNFPLPNSGALDAEELKTLDEITKWMAVNSEGIYATRPWKVFGGGPGTDASAQPGNGMNNTQGHFNERNRKTLVAEDVRYTKKGNALYAFSMGAQAKEAVFPHLGTKSDQNPGKIQNVQLLGYKGKVQWKQEEGGLKIQVPAQKPCDHALVFKVTGA